MQRKFFSGRDLEEVGLGGEDATHHAVVLLVLLCKKSQTELEETFSMFLDQVKG